MQIQHLESIPDLLKLAWNNEETVQQAKKLLISQSYNYFWACERKDCVKDGWNFLSVNVIFLLKPYI